MYYNNYPIASFEPLVVTKLSAIPEDMQKSFEIGGFIESAWLPSEILPNFLVVTLHVQFISCTTCY